MEEQQELPKGWFRTTLGEAYQIVGGGTPSTENKAFWEGDVPWISSADIDAASFKVTPWRYVTKVAVESSATNVVPAGTVIVVTRVGLGKVCLAETDICFSQDSQGLIAKNQNLDSGYALHFVTKAARAFKSQSRGTTISGITKKQLQEVEFLIPPHPEQRRIVAKLEELFSKLDAGVAAVRRTQALLKRYRQSVLHAAVTGELTRAWREAHPAPAETGAALLQRIRAERRAQWEAAQVAKRGGQLPLGDGWKSKYVEPEAVDAAELPELPEGWVWATSEQLCSSVASGSTPKPEELFSDQGEIPFLKVYNLTKTGHLDFTNKPTFIREQIHNGQLNRSRVNPGDVLINIVGPPLGKVSLVTDEYPEWNINQAIVAFKAVSGYSNKFLLTCMLTETIMNWLLRTAKTTTSQVNLSVTMCRQLPLPVPSVAEQVEIVAEVERRLTVLDALTHTLTDELKRAERLRQSILHRAFTGRLVPQDATDEPAAALLARLREAPAAPAKAHKSREASAMPAKEKKPRGRKPIDITQIDFSFLDK